MENTTRTGIVIGYPVMLNTRYLAELDQLERSGFNLKDYQQDLYRLTRVLYHKLGDDKNKARASQAANWFKQLYSHSVTTNDYGNKPLACKKGCKTCCVLYVSARAPELFNLANAILAMEDEAQNNIIRKLEKADARTRGLNSDERFDVVEPCPLLDEKAGACTLYNARPISCRTLVSTNHADCMGCIDGTAEGVEVPDCFTYLRGALDVAMWAGLKANNLNAASYELNHGLLTVLKTQDAEQRWLGGEDIFADVAIDNSDDTSDQTPLAEDYHIDMLIVSALHC